MQRFTLVLQSIQMSWIDRDRAVVTDDCFSEASKPRQQQASFEMRVDEIRRQRYEIVIANQSLIVPLQRGKYDAQGVSGRSRLWISQQAVPQKTFCRL